MINIIKNNKIKILIFGIVMILCMIICMNYTKAYQLNDKGELVSQNLLNNTLDNTSEEGLYELGTINLNAGTYTFKIYISSGTTTEYDFRINNVNYGSRAINDSLTFTINSNITNGTVSCYINGTANNIKAQINSGETALQYEPYGTWYPYKNEYTTNNFGNITSDNLFNLNDLNTNASNYTINVYTNEFTGNNVNTTNILKKNINWEENTQYTISYFLTNNDANARLRVYLTNGDYYDMVEKPNENNEYHKYTNPKNTTIASIGATWGSGTAWFRAKNVMVNKGIYPKTYVPYGEYLSKDNAQYLNQLYMNFEYIEFGTESGYDNLDTTYAPYYMDISTYNFYGYLEQVGIDQTTIQYQTGRQGFGMKFIKALNMSAFVYHLRFSADPNYFNENDMYIAFVGENGTTYNITYFTHEISYDIELPYGAVVKQIEIHWETTESHRCYLEDMTTNEYRKGFNEGTKNGYNTGYESGFTKGKNEGIEEGIDQRK